jgi:hypothetical protein
MSNGESAPAPAARPPAAAPPRDAGYRDRLFRVITFVVVLGSVVVIWWSFVMVLLPRLKQSRELSSMVSRSSAEVDDLEHQWTKAGAEQVSNQFSQVEVKLFEDRAGVEAWLADLKDQAALLALDVRADLGPASPQTVGGRTLTVIPATVSVEVQSARPEMPTPSPYQRILRLSQRLTGEDKRADLTELTVAGGTNSIGRAVLVLNYWTGKERAP